MGGKTIESQTFLCLADVFTLAVIRGRGVSNSGRRPRKPQAMIAAVNKARTLRIVDLLRPHWKAMTLALLAVGGVAAADLLDPWPIKIVLDYALQSRPMPGWMTGIVGLFGGSRLAILNFAVAAVAVIALAGAASSYLQSYLTVNVGQRIMHDLRRTVYHHIHRLSLAEHDERRTGDLISRVTSDIDSIQDFVTSAMLGIVANVLTLLGIVGIMLYASWRFTLISLAIAPALFVVVYFFTRRIKKAAREVRKTEGELISIVEEVLSSIRVVKAFAREDYEERRFERQSLDNVEAALQARNMKMLLAPAVDAVVATGTCLMLGYGARMAMADELTPGVLVVFLAYLRMMYKPMRDLSKMADTASKAGVGFERIREVLEIESAVRDRPHARKARGFEGRVDFEHVSFSYTPDQPVLEDLSFTIEPGQVAAFVGETGGGKTSIVNLIARFYDPTSGMVKIDGTDIRGFTLKSLRDQISFVLQDTLLFRAPVWQNIAYGRPEARRAEIVRAAEQANADEFIREMPGGLRRDGRRARCLAVRRTAPAHRHRARNGPQRADPDPRRADVRPRRADREGDHGSARAPDEGQDVHRHRAPPGHHPARRRDLRDEGPPARGAGHARRAARRRRRLRGALPDPARRAGGRGCARPGRRCRELNGAAARRRSATREGRRDQTVGKMKQKTEKLIDKVAGEGCAAVHGRCSCHSSAIALASALAAASTWASALPSAFASASTLASALASTLASAFASASTLASGLRFGLRFGSTLASALAATPPRPSRPSSRP